MVPLSREAISQIDKLDSDLKTKKKDQIITNNMRIKQGFSFGQDKIHPINQDLKKMDSKGDYKSTIKRSTTLGPSTATQIIPKSSRQESIRDQPRNSGNHRRSDVDSYI